MYFDLARAWMMLIEATILAESTCNSCAFAQSSEHHGGTATEQHDVVGFEREGVDDARGVVKFESGAYSQRLVNIVQITTFNVRITHAREKAVAPTSGALAVSGCAPRVGRLGAVRGWPCTPYCPVKRHGLCGVFDSANAGQPAFVTKRVIRSEVGTRLAYNFLVVAFNDVLKQAH